MQAATSCKRVQRLQFKRLGAAQQAVASPAPFEAGFGERSSDEINQYAIN
jgi:hypothetical protein